MEGTLHRLAVVTLLGFVSPAHAAPNPDYRIDPTLPAWVEEVALPPSSAERSDDHVQELLDDRQDRVGAAPTQRFMREARRIGNAAGVQAASEIDFSYDPSYESLTLHFIRLHRDAAVIDALAQAELRVIQREDQLEQRIYDGGRSVLAVLTDVREGDTLDYAYTIAGDNPALAGHYETAVRLARARPVAEIRFRLVWERAAPPSFRGHATALQPTQERAGTTTLYRWRASEVGGLEWEDDTPAWYEQTPWIQISSFGDWTEVVRWGLPLYAAATQTSPELQRVADDLAAAHATDAERAAAALRFVQEEVRYFGFELGAGSLAPHPAAQTLARRFGDCKDKVVLLITLLGRMGITAKPVLAHTSRGVSLPNRLPSVGAFNHAIARIDLDRPYYVDATLSHQRGDFAAMEVTDYGSVLVLDPGERALTRLALASAQEPDVEVHERSWLESGRTVGHIEVTTRYRGGAADHQRASLAISSASSRARVDRNFYAQDDIELRQHSEPEVIDDPAANILVVKEHYVSPKFWREEAWDFHAWLIDEQLSRPTIIQRKAPLGIPFPLHVRHTIEFRTPEPWNIVDGDGHLEGDALSFNYSWTYEAMTLKLSYTLRTTADHVPPDRISQHLALLDKIYAHAGYRIWKGAGGEAPPFSIGWPLGMLLGVALVASTIASVGRLRSRWRRARLRRSRRFDWGEAPESAIEVPSWEQVQETLATLLCRCRRGQRLVPNPEPASSMSYDDTELRVYLVACPACQVALERFVRCAESSGGGP